MAKNSLKKNEKKFAKGKRQQHIKKHCPSCDRLEYLEQCDTCKREFCIETCLGLYHGSEKLWCKDCFDKQSTKEKAIMLSKNKKNRIRK